MPTGYILVNCTLGSEEKIINEIAKLPDHTITNKIRKIPGITSTVTLVVIEEQGGKG
jgi:hypothetical protein